MSCSVGIVRADNKSGVVGVFKVKNRNKWRAQICVKRKCIHIPCDGTFMGAVTARKEAELKYFGKLLEYGGNFMKVVMAYECRCGHIYKNIDSIRKCRFCGKEICGECARFTGTTCFQCGQILSDYDYNSKLMQEALDIEGENNERKIE